MADDPDTLQQAKLELAPERVAELAASGEAVLIDVRQDYEWERGRIAGARHVEVNQLTAEAASIPKDRPVVFCCRSGSRSGMAAQAFRAGGWDAHNMADGITAWVGAGFELEPENGTVAEARPPSA
ncbi:MAG: rhodanese-like domain-containing protein [bacterium]